MLGEVSIRTRFLHPGGPASQSGQWMAMWAVQVSFEPTLTGVESTSLGSLCDHHHPQSSESGVTRPHRRLAEPNGPVGETTRAVIDPPICPCLMSRSLGRSRPALPGRELAVASSPLRCKIATPSSVHDGTAQRYETGCSYSPHCRASQSTRSQM